MICKYCLTKIDDDSVFCESCGSRVQEIGNNDETQLIPKVEELGKTSVNGTPSGAASSAGHEKDIPVSDISKLLAEIYDEEDQIYEESETEIVNGEEKTELAKDVTDNVIPDLQYEDTTEHEEQAMETECDSMPVKVEEEFHEYECSDMNEAAPLFCMACGRRLPEGAAFCDTCGTPTGAVSPGEIRRRKTKNSIAMPILKGYFIKPAETIEKAVSEETAALGAGIFIIKDILAAVISALCMTRLTAGMADSWILSGDAFGFAAKVFLLAVLADVILIAILFGMGIIFKAAGTVRELIGVCGVSSLLPSILWLLALVLKGFVPVVSIYVSLAAVIISVLFIGKAIDASGRMKANRSMYMTAITLIIYMALIYGGFKWMIA